MERNVSRGYNWKDGELQVNGAEAKIVKWIYKMVIEYHDNPPDILVREVIDKYEEEEISYGKAKERVSLTMVKKYMVEELNTRIEQYERNDREDTASKLENFLEIPLDEELLDIIEERYKSNYEDTYNMNPFSANKIGRYFKDIESLSGDGYKSYEVESLISKEIYKAAIEKMEENRELPLNENLNDNSAMMVE